MTTSSSKADLNLALATLSFAICFAAWGLMSALAPYFRDLLHLDATQTALLVVVPVLLGSLARVPMGMLADRIGGRAIFTGLMLVVAVPTALVATAESYHTLLLVAFFLGLAGSSFAVGVGFVSRRYVPERQGTAVGIYGVGNIGQSAVVFGGPLLAAVLGWQKVVAGLAALLVVWAIIFAVVARDPQDTARPTSLGEMISVLRRERLSWALSAFYFLTFGGFVAFSIYLPSLLRRSVSPRSADAGFRTAGFVVLATAAASGRRLAFRPDRRRTRIVSCLSRDRSVRPVAGLVRRCFRSPSEHWAVPLLLGLGNGAVFKLVPQYFPLETGTVTGLVGAHGRPWRFLPAATSWVSSVTRRERSGLGFVLACRYVASSCGG